MFYLNLFFIFSIIGYILETLIFFLINKNYNSSVLYGPWTPIYGIAVLLMIVVYIFIKKFKFSNKKEKMVYFLTITFVLTLLEGSAGYIIELTQKKVYWNYDNFIFNIGHYMTLEISLIWGILAYFSVYYLIPKSKKFINKIPKLITFVLIILIILDCILSFYV